MDINKFASAQLADARYNARLSLDDLVQKTGISKSALSRLLSGKQKSVPLDSYLRVLKACGASEKENLTALWRAIRR